MSSSGMPWAAARKGEPDPYQRYDWQRQNAPASLIVDATTEGTAWFVTSYDLVQSCLVDPLLSTDGRHASTAAIDGDVPAGRSLLGTDGPDHDELRRLVAGSFSPPAIDATRPAIARICQSAIDSFAAQGHADLVADYALVVPVLVIHEILGIPPDQQETPAACMDRFWRASFSRPPDGDAFELLHSYIRRLVAYKRAHPGDDVTTRLLRNLERGELRNERELHDMLYMLLGAGHTTTVLALATAILRLLEHPEDLSSVLADPDLWPQVIEEVLRHDSTVHVAARRYALEDMTIGDMQIEKGAAVLLSPAAANRDPRRFDDPGRFNLGRASRSHLGFGRGTHSCLGIHLARVEMETALRMLFESLLDLRLAIPSAEVKHILGPRLHGPAELPVTFPPRPTPGAGRPPRRGGGSRG